MHTIVICVNKVVPVHQIGTCPFVSHSKMAKKYDFTIIIICRAGLCESVHHNTLICRYGDNNMHLRYGDIHSVSLFGHPVVVLSSLTAIEEFRAASPDNFTHRWSDRILFAWFQCNMRIFCVQASVADMVGQTGAWSCLQGHQWVPSASQVSFCAKLNS